jgi:RNA polymerase sigma-70 factor (ECF subfamily)
MTTPPPGPALEEREEAARLILCIAQHRDRAAFAQLYSLYGPRLRGFLLRGGLSEAEVEELLQDVMLVAWQRADRFDPSKASVSTWLFTIARNRRIDRFRRQRRPELDAGDPSFVPSSPHQPDEQLAGLREEGRLREAMLRLPPEQREILERAWMQDSSYREVAEQESVPLGTVKSRVRLALQFLRSALGERETEP